MTQNPDIAGQTTGAGTGPSGDGTSGSGGGYSSGQTGARVMLGALLVVCVVGLVWAFWPAERGSMMIADPTAQDSAPAGETPGTDTLSVAPGTDRIEENDATPEPANVDPADAGEGLGTDPDLDATDEEEPRDDPEIDPTDQVAPADPPGSGGGR